VGRHLPERYQAAGDGHAALRPGTGQHHGGGRQRHRVALHAAEPEPDALRYFVLVPEALVVGTAVVLVVFVATKFSHGAWMVIVLLPILVLLLLGRKRHYARVGRERRGAAREWCLRAGDRGRGRRDPEGRGEVDAPVHDAPAHAVAGGHAGARWAETEPSPGPRSGVRSRAPVAPLAPSG